MRTIPQTPPTLRGQADFGGLAEYWTLRPIFSGEVKEDIFPADRNFFDDKRAAVVQIPDDLSDLEASFIEPTTGALRSLLTNPPKIGDKVITGSVIKRVLAPNSVVSIDANKDRNFYAEEHFSQRAYLPDELIETVEDNTFYYVFDALAAVKVADESKDPRRVAMRKIKPGGRSILYGAAQQMQKFDDYDGIVRIFETYRNTTDLKTIIDFRDAESARAPYRVSIAGQ